MKEDFARAFGSGIASSRLDGLPASTVPRQMMVGKNASAAREVRDARAAVGSAGSPAGSALWFVAGTQMSIRDWRCVMAGTAGGRIVMKPRITWLQSLGCWPGTTGMSDL